MGEMTLNCPHCSAEISLDEGYAGQTLQCPQCQGAFTVPEVAAPAGPQMPSLAGVSIELPPMPKVDKWTYILGAASIPVLLWGMIIAERAFGMRFGSGEPSEDPVMPIWLGILVTVVAPIIAYFMYLRAAGVAKNPLEVSATITKLSSGEVQGMRNVSFVYEVSGKRYKKRKSFSSIELGPVQPGSLIELVVDKRNPKRCYLKASLYS